MKGWDEYFNKEVNEENETKSKEDQVDWIFGILEKLSDTQVEEVYKLVESKIEEK